MNNFKAFFIILACTIIFSCYLTASDQLSLNYFDKNKYSQIFHDLKQINSELPDKKVIAKIIKKYGFEENIWTSFIINSDFNDYKNITDIKDINGNAFILAGDLTESAEFEYIIAFGWTGPYRGNLYIYNAALLKICDVKANNITGIKIEDVNADNKDEMIVFSAEHQPTQFDKKKILIVIDH